MRALVMLPMLLCCVAATAAPGEVPRQLTACGDINEFPPYTYFERDAGKMTPVVAGFNVDYLGILLNASQRSVTVELLPWKRCLLLGALGKFDLVLDVSGQALRQRDFYIARSHYSIRPIMMFSETMPPPPGDTPEVLARYKRCEVLGWDYSLYKLRPDQGGVTNPSTLDGALRMLRVCRCQVMVHNLELVLGMRQVGKAELLKGLTYRPITWLPTYDLHIAVSRKLTYARPLVDLLNRGRQDMDRAGEIQKLQRKYLSE